MYTSSGFIEERADIYLYIYLIYKGTDKKLEQVDKRQSKLKESERPHCPN